MFSKMTLAGLERYCRLRMTEESEQAQELISRTEELVATFQDYIEFRDSDPSPDALEEATEGLIIRFNRMINGGDA